jgi:23S rRNA (cytosine1962-C5)-methyltransferase
MMFSTEKFLEAVKKRESLRSGFGSDRLTNAYRLVDGEGDGLPGLIIDNFAGRWIVQTYQNNPPNLDSISGFHSLYWKELSKTDKTGAPRHLAGETVTEPFEIVENGLQYSIDFAAGYSQGIFLDQRDNRRRLRELAKGLRVLNTFSYTCAFGVSAAAGGALTVNVDLSRRYLDWGRSNYEQNGFPTNAHEFIYGDVFEWLDRFEKKGRLFDMIVLDPPTFSRPRRSTRDFRVKDHYGGLVEQSLRCLAPHGRLLCTTNFRGITTGKFRSLVAQSVPKKARIIAKEMPRDFSGEKYLKSLWVEL